MAVHTTNNTFHKYCAIYLVVFAILFGFAGDINAQFYSGSQLQFGKNRVKYESFFWTYYRYNRYDVYFYEEGKDLAKYVSEAAAKHLGEIETLMDYTIDDRIEFIVFNKHSDFKQSNIGHSSNDQYNVGGITKIVGTKVILYYEGDHAKLDAQIRAGIAEILVNQMMFGGNLSNMVKNSSMLFLPDWYVQGLSAYIAYGWNTEVDNRVKDGILSRRYKNISFLEGDDAKYAGHAFWKHIANNYGDATIRDLLYVTRVSHNIDNATLYVLGQTVRSVWDECVTDFVRRYDSDNDEQAIPEKGLIKRPKATRVYNQVRVSPDGNTVAFATNELGQNKIWLYDVATQKTKRIYKANHKMARANDYSYPLLAWHPNGEVLTFIIERKGYIVMQFYDIKSESFTERNITGFEKVLSYSYHKDGKLFAMSAVKKGQTDIYVFTASSSANFQVTNDIYDDLNPCFVSNGKEIAFSSNRPGDTLYYDKKRTYPPRQDYFDVFMFDNTNKSPVLKRITKTPNVNEVQAHYYDSAHVAYLSDANGIYNRYVAHIDSTIAFVDTITHYKPLINSKSTSNYERSIIEQDINPKAGKYAEVIYNNGKYHMFVNDMVKSDSLRAINLSNTSYRNHTNNVLEIKQEEQKASIKNQIEIKTIAVKKDTSTADNSIDINNYVFADEENERITKKKIADSLNAGVNDKFQIAKQVNYYTVFSLDYVMSQVDNSYLARSYQRYAGGGSPVYLNPGLNAFFQVSISDLFEDYQIIGGSRFSTDLSNNEYFITFEDRKRNLDKQLVLYRQKLNAGIGANGISKIYTHDARFILKYPFSEVSGIRWSIDYRNNRQVIAATDANSLPEPNTFENWASTLVEYVFDNSLPKGLNLYNGTRAKVFAEYSKQIDKKNTNFYVVGFDARYYQKIHRDFIWANRIAASTSFGDQRLIYYLGGVDSWFLPRFNTSTNIDNTQNYAYQTLATNMRGFIQNARNGNSFAVINSELRLPVFKYFLKRNLSSDFIQNFQVVSFADIGTAWNGTTPYSDDGPTNTLQVGNAQTPLIITINATNNPIIGGFGWGLRSRLWGYFVRVDRAWGVQDGNVLKPITYLSLSLDF